MRFVGSAAAGKTEVGLTFTAEVDDTGALSLDIEPLPAASEGFELVRSFGTDSQAEYLQLEGVGPQGETFRSETFFLTGYGHKSGDTGSELAFKGACAEAEIVHKLSEPIPYPQLRWMLRGFRSFGALEGRIDGGRVVIGGGEPSADQPQQLTGFLIAQADTEVEAGWFARMDAELDHLARTLSLASGVYLQPYVEMRFDGDENRMRLFRRSQTPTPFLPPIHFLNLGPVFKSALAAGPEKRARFKALDAALRWLTTPAHYDEIRLLGAMTALENIVEGAYPSDRHPIIAKAAFKRLAKAIRDLITGLGLPEVMKTKIPELNRASFVDKVARYIDDHRIVIADFPEGGLPAVIRARNRVVHTGVYFDDELQDQTDLWQHILVGRELVIRILLDVLGFEGNYFSALHADQQLMFPSCRRVTDDNRLALADDDPAGDPRPPVRFSRVSALLLEDAAVDEAEMDVAASAGTRA